MSTPSEEVRAKVAEDILEMNVREHKEKYPTFNEEQFMAWWNDLSPHWQRRWRKKSIAELNNKRKKRKSFINWAQSQK